MSLPIKEHLGRSVLLDLDTIDLPDPVEHVRVGGGGGCGDAQAMFYRFVQLLEEWRGRGSSEVGARVLHRAAQGAEAYKGLVQGLLYGILTEPEECISVRRPAAAAPHPPQYFQMAASAVNDGWAQMTEQLKYFTFTRYGALRPAVRAQLFWLVNRLVSLGPKGCDGLLLGLLRQIKAGHRSAENMTTVQRTLDLLGRHQEWLLAQPALIPYVLYPLIRLLAEDLLPADTRSQILALVLRILYERYRECALLGRELARALLEVSQVPEVQRLWAWLLAPKGPEPAPLLRLLLTPTPRKYLSMRLTVPAEEQLRFMLEQANSAQQSFYASLFLETHVPSTPEDDPGAFVVDLIRYIVAAHHPSNAQLASAVIPRWSLIILLLKSLKTSYAAASAKLALLLDWFFFDPANDSIMCVEPGLLVIVRSVVNHPNIAATLLDFLRLERDALYPPMAGEITRSLDRALAFCVEKRVVPGIEGLLATPMLQEDVKGLVRALFPASCPLPVPVPVPDAPQGARLVTATDRLASHTTSPAPPAATGPLVDEWLDALREHAERGTADPAAVERLSVFFGGGLLCLLAAADQDRASRLCVDAISAGLAACKKSLPELLLIHARLQPPPPAEPIRRSPAADLPRGALGPHFYPTLRRLLPAAALHAMAARPELKTGIVPRALRLAALLDAPPASLAGLVRGAMLCRSVEDTGRGARAAAIADFESVGVLVAECLAEAAPTLDESESRELADFLPFLALLVPPDPPLIGRLGALLATLHGRASSGARQGALSVLLILRARGLALDWAAPAMSALRAQLRCPELEEALG